MQDEESMDPQLVKPVLKDIKQKFETTTPKNSDTCSEARVRPKRVKRDNPEWLKATKVEPPDDKVDDFQNLKRSSSVSVSKKSFEIPSTCKSSNTDIPSKERPKKTVRDNPEWLKTSKIESQSNKTEDFQNIKRSSSVSVQSSKTSFETATTKNQSVIVEKPKKTVLDNPEWLKSSQVDSSTNKIDQVRERASSVSVRTSKTSFEGKKRDENSFKAWKQKKDSEKLAEDAHLSSLYGHLSPEEKKVEIECMKMKRNIEAQIKVEAQYNEKVVAVLQLEKPGVETRTVKFTNVGAGIAGNFTSLSCTISELKTPEQIKAEQGLLAKSICCAEQEALDAPPESNNTTGVKENGEVDSESIKFTDVKAGIAEQFTDNLMLKTPEQMKAENLQKKSGQNIAQEDSIATVEI